MVEAEVRQYDGNVIRIELPTESRAEFSVKNNEIANDKDT